MDENVGRRACRILNQRLYQVIPRPSSQCDFIMFWRRVVSDILQGIKNLNFCSTEQQTNKIHYIWVMWEDQAWLSNNTQAMLVSKCLNNVIPAYFSDQSTRNANYHLYNTRSKDNLHIPKVKLSLGKRTFRFSGGYHLQQTPKCTGNRLNRSKF